MWVDLRGYPVLWLPQRCPTAPQPVNTEQEEERGGSFLMIGTGHGRLRGSSYVCGVQAPAREHCGVRWDGLSCQVLCHLGVAG